MANPRTARLPRTAHRLAVLLLAATAAACDGTPDLLPPAGGGPPAEKPLHHIRVTPGAHTMLEGHMVQLDASFHAADETPVGARPLQWTSADSTIASVNALGTVRAHRPGTTTITVAHGDRRAYAEIVVDTLRVARITVTQQIVHVGFWQTVRVGAYPVAQDGRSMNVPVTWTTSTPEVATVDSTGRIQGRLAGSASVKARVGDVVAEVVVYSAGPVMPGNWRLSVTDLKDEDENSVCFVADVRLEITGTGLRLDGGTKAWSSPQVSCSPLRAGVTVTTPVPPAGGVVGSRYGASVSLQFEQVEWSFSGEFVSADRVEGEARYVDTWSGPNGFPVIRTGRFVLTRI
jgi:hypothetical protein